MDQPKRILYVITKASWGGAQKYVYELAVAAHAAGHEVAVAYGEAGLLARKLEASGIRTIAIGGLTRDVHTVNEASALRNLQTLFANERPDIVHLNSSKAAGLGALAARFAGVRKILFTAHGWAFNEDRPLLERSIIWVLSGLTVLLSHETICVSQAVARDIRGFPFASRKLVMIHIGIECQPPMPREEARAKLMLSHTEGFWIGMLSELHPTKRIEDAIEAFSEVREAHPEALLLVAGEGERRARLEMAIREKGLTKSVFLLGFVADAPLYLSAFDLLLHTSQSEALAYAVLEAGCASLPVVATAVGGIPEIVQDGLSGLLIPARDPHAAASAIMRMIDHPELRASCAAALHSRVISAFSKEQMISRTRALYA